MAALSPGDFGLATSEGTLHYTITGAVPACLALSGGPGVDPSYLEDLGGLTDMLTLVTLHPRGAGRSHFPDEADWSLSAYARDIHALCRHLGLERPLVLGHSHGGWIVQHYALAYPQELSCLILVGSAPRGFAASGWNEERPCVASSTNHGLPRHTRRGASRAVPMSRWNRPRRG